MATDHRRCQLHSRLSQPTLGLWLRTLVDTLRGRIRLRSRLRHLFAGPPKETPRLGRPSRFAAGTWVRVVDAGRVFATLDAKKQLRGLLWVWQQWPYCGTVHRVFKPVRRMMDDAHQVRPISGTVLLDTAPCGGPFGQHGCGRECPLMFRDEWLEEVPPPDPVAEPPPDAPQATVRSADEIRRMLDADGSYRGLMFMPEMAAHAGKRFPIMRKVAQVLEGGRYVPTAEPIYILAGLHCDGTILGADGPCERACRLLWHADWLHLPA